MAKSSEISEESSDWEEIQHTSTDEPSSPTTPHARLHDFELVIRDNFYDDGSIFPPSDHEDLPLLGEDYNSPRIMSPSRSRLSSSSSDNGLPKEDRIKSHSRLSIMINGIGTRMYLLTRRVFQNGFCRSSSRCSSIITGAAIVFILFASMKILQWRNRLLLLLGEKDQRISQLLQQIAHMNEILSARRKVPVLRIN